VRLSDGANLSDYVAPLRGIRFVLTELAGLEEIGPLPGCEDVTADRRCDPGRGGEVRERVLAPLTWVGSTRRRARQANNAAMAMRHAFELN